MTYPTYTRAERIADGAIHGLGIGFGVTALVLLAIWSASHGAGTIAASWVYGIALVACFTASAIYHFSPSELWRPAFRRCDHAFIYLKIAGTYTPLVVLIGSWFAYAVLAVVWTLAVVGMVMKLAFWRTPGRFGPVLYLVMGWLSVALMWPLAQTMPLVTTWLIVAGGLTYSLGVVFYTAEGWRFSVAIWHGFVLAASICFFVAIAFGLMQG